MTRSPPTPPQDDATLGEFARCHEGILGRLDALAGLPELLERGADARGPARQAVALFHDVVLEHHADEEDELFTAVLECAQPGDESAQARTLVHRLTAEHRSIEAAWKLLEPRIRDAARGSPVVVDAVALGALIDSYTAHARFEEAQFLPFAARVLGRNSNHLAALGASLHMRHAPSAGLGYL